MIKKLDPVAILFGLTCAMLALGAYHSASYTRICVAEKKIRTIVSVDYRTATVQFEDGTHKVIDQGTVKPGDILCAEYKQVKVP